MKIKQMNNQIKELQEKCSKQVFFVNSFLRIFLNYLMMLILPETVLK